MIVDTAFISSVYDKTFYRANNFHFPGTTTKKLENKIKPKTMEHKSIAPS